MLFKHGNHTLQFYLLGLEAAERNEIENLITENGGAISTVMKPPAFPFGTEESIHTPVELLFHVNFIRECVSQKKILQLSDFVITPRDFYACLQCMFTHGVRTCLFRPSSASDSLPTLTSTQIESSSGINRTDDQNETQQEHSYACAVSVDTQEADNSVEKQPWDEEQFTEMLNCTPTDSQFLPLESQPDEAFLPLEVPRTADFMVPESTQDSEFHLVESPQDSDFLPDESPPDGGFRLGPESTYESTNIVDGTQEACDIPPEQTPEEANLVLDMECSSDDSSMSVVPATPDKDDSFDRNGGIIPIKFLFLAEPVKLHSDQETIEVPEAARFEELACGQEAKIGVASSTSEIRAEPGTSNERTTGVGTKEALARLAEFSLDSDDTNYEPDLSRSGVLTKQERLSPLKRKLQEEDNAQSPEVIDLTTEDDELIEASSEEEKTARVKILKTTKSQKQNQAAYLDITTDDDQPIEASRAEKKPWKTKGLKKPQSKPADVHLSTDDAEPIEASREKNKQRKAEKSKTPRTKAADLDLSTDDDEPIEASREKNKRRKAEKSKTPRKKDADLDLSTDDDEPIEASREKNKRRKADKWQKRRTKVADPDQQPLTSSMEKPKTTSDGRSTAVSSTRSGDAMSTDDSDTSFDEEEAPGSSRAENSRNEKTHGTKKVQSLQNTEKYPRPTRNFLPWEQRLMVKYLIDNNFVNDAKGLRVWKQMIDDGMLTHRTPQSLNNHFRKVVLPTIHRFSMNQKFLTRFQRLQLS